MHSDDEFSKLMATCHELSEWFPDGLVFIGGLAVYAHCKNAQETQDFVETTHGGGFYVSLSDFCDLRSMEELVGNARLSKHQWLKRGQEFDIYVERQSNLRIPYDEIVADSVLYGHMRVASLAHTMLLKLAAFHDRKGSLKGEKDERDLIRLLLVAYHHPNLWDIRHALAYIDDDDKEVLKRLPKSKQIVSLTNGNAHEAKIMRDNIQAIVNTCLDQTTVSIKTKSSPSL